MAAPLSNPAPATVYLVSTGSIVDAVTSGMLNSNKVFSGPGGCCSVENASATRPLEATPRNDSNNRDNNTKISITPTTPPQCRGLLNAIPW